MNLPYTMWDKKRGLLEKAEEERGEIYFSDETKMKSDHSFGRSYSRSQKIRQSIWLQRDINVIQQWHNAIHDLSGKSHQGYISAFINPDDPQSKKKNLSDSHNHSAHRAKKVENWLDKNKRKNQDSLL